MGDEGAGDDSLRKGACAGQAYCDAGTCVAKKQLGEACDGNNVECVERCGADSNGMTVCMRWKKNGEPCFSDSECGGSNPPNSWGACNDEGKCHDVAETIGKAVGAAIGIFFILPLLIGACVLILIIWCCCCKRKQTVVV